MSESKIIAKLKKLLARAKDQSDTPEGELAASIAAKLMQEHAISMAQLEDHEVREEILHLQWDEEVSNVWWSLLYHMVGDYVDVKVAYAKWGRKRKITFVGYAHNIEICKFLFDSIKVQLENDYKKHCAEVKKRCQEKGYSYRSNKPKPKPFYVSAIRVVQTKLRNMKREQQYNDTQDSLNNESIAKATSLVFQRKNEVNAFVSKLGWSSGASYRAGHSSAGASAGHNVRVQSGLTGSKRLKG